MHGNTGTQHRPLGRENRPWNQFDWGEAMELGKEE